jgi:uncharacterized membrane protein YcaP (DUF421 family)
MSWASEWFALTVSPWELIARGTILYLGLILVLRFVLRRDIGSLSVADIMFIVIVADASQNALSGEYKSITEGAILVGTLVAWNVVLDWLAYRSPRFRRVLEPPALPLIKDGRIIRANLRKEWITVDELEAKLRESGIDDVAQVRVAYLESSGELGVIRVDKARVERKARNVQGTK